MASDGTLRFNTKLDNSAFRKGYNDLQKLIKGLRESIEVGVEIKQDALTDMMHEIVNGCRKIADEIDKEMASSVDLTETIDAMTGSGQDAGHGFAEGCAQAAGDIDAQMSEAVDLSGTTGLFETAGADAGRNFASAVARAMQDVSSQMESILSGGTTPGTEGTRARAPIRFHGMVGDENDYSAPMSPGTYDAAKSAIDGLETKVAELGLAFSRINMDEIPAEWAEGVASFEEVVDEARERLADLQAQWGDLKTAEGFSQDALDGWLADIESAKAEFAEIQDDLNLLGQKGGYQVYFELISPEEHASMLEEYQKQFEASKQSAREFEQAYQDSVTKPEGKAEAAAEAINKTAEGASAAAKNFSLLGQSASVSSQRIADLQSEYDRLTKRQAELRSAGLGLGHTEYDENLVRMQQIREETKRYQQNLIGAGNAQQSIGRSGKSIFSSLTSAVSRLGKAAQHAFGALASGASKFVGTLGRGAATAVRNMGLFRTHTDKTNISMQRLVKNILRYGLGIRSLFVLFNKIRALGVSGFERLAQASDETNGAISRIKTAISSLANSMAAALNPALQALEPIITRLLTSLGKLIDGFGMLIASLTGKTTYTRVIDQYEDYAKSLEKKAEKKEKKYLSGLDEMRRWESNDTEEKPKAQNLAIEENIPDWAKQLRDLLKAGDWAGLGKWLADKINDALESAYKKIKEWTPKVWAAMDAIAEAFNSLVKNLDWELLGKAIGAFINMIAGAINHLVDGIDWVALGQGLARALNGLLDEVDWQELGRALAAKIRILTDLFYGFLTNVDWKKLGTSLAELINGFIQSINWKRIGEVFSLALDALFTALQGFNESLDWESIGRIIPDAIKGAIEKADPAKWGATLGQFLNNVLKALKDTAEGIPWKELGEDIGIFIQRFFANHDLSEWTSTLVVWLNGIMAAMGEAAKQIPFAAIGKQIGDAIKRFFEEGDFKAWGQTFNRWIQGLLDLLVEATNGDDGKYQTIGNSIGEFLSQIDWKQALSKVGTVIRQVLGGVLEAIFDGAADSPETKFFAAFALAFGGLDIASKIAGMFGKGSALDAAFSFLAGHPVLAAAGAIVGVATALGAFDDINVDWDALKEAVGGAMDRVGTVFSETIDGEAIKKAGENIGSALNAIVDAAILAAPGIFEGIEDFLELMAWAAGMALDGVAGLINGIANAFEALTNSALVQGIIDLNKALNEFFDYSGISTEEAQAAADGYAESLGKLAAYGDEEAFGIIKTAIEEISDPALYDPTNLDNLVIDLDAAASSGQSFNDWVGYIGDVLGNTGVPLDEFNGLVSEAAGGLDLVGTNAQTAAEQIGVMEGVATDTAEAAGSIGELLSSLEQSTEISDYEKLSALIEALENTTSTTGDTDGKLGELAEQMRTVQSNDGNFSGYIDDVAAKLETAGVNSDAFKNALITAIKNMGAEVPKELKTVSSAVESFAPTIDSSAQKLGNATGDGYVSGTKAKTKDMETATTTAAKSSLAAMDKELGISGNKSSKTENSGKAVDEGLAQGVSKNIGAPQKSAKEVADKGIIEIFDKELKITGNTSQTGKDDGTTVDTGLGAGMDAGQSTVRTAAQNVSKVVLDTIDSVLTTQAAETRGKSFINALASSISSMGWSLRDAMNSALQPAQEALNNFVANLGSAFNGVVAPFNTFIGRLNALLSGVQTIQNEIARLLSFNITFPADVAQRVGYNGFVMNVPALYSGYQMPFLAKGAVIPPNAPFAAVLGDQRSGTNIEAPLDTIKDALLKALEEYARMLSSAPSVKGLRMSALGGFALPQAPYMASGSVIPPASSYAGRRADSAIESLRDAVRMALSDSSPSRGNSAPTKLVNMISGRVFLEVMLDEGKNMMMQTGRNPFTALSPEA